MPPGDEEALGSPTAAPGRAAGPTTRARSNSKASRPQRTLNRSLGTHPSPLPAPTRHTGGPSSDNHPTPQRTSRTFRPKATRAQWKRDLGAQARPRWPNTHQTTSKDYTATLGFMNRASNDFPYILAYRARPRSLMFVLCLCLFVCLFVCLSVCLYVAVCTRDNLGHPPLNCLSAAPGHCLLP